MIAVIDTTSKIQTRRMLGND